MKRALVALVLLFCASTQAAGDNQAKTVTIGAGERSARSIFNRGSGLELRRGLFLVGVALKDGPGHIIAARPAGVAMPPDGVKPCDGGDRAPCGERPVRTTVADATVDLRPVHEKQVTFGNIGDYGADNKYNKAVANVLRKKGAEFITTNGDNRYGAKRKIRLTVGLAYGDFVAAGQFFPAIGNHDYGDGGGIGEYFSYFELPGNERYYSVVRGSVEIFVINSEPQEPDGGGDYPSAQGIWLLNAIAASKASWQFVFMHRPPFSSGKRHGSSARMQRWPFEAMGADAVFAGHDHTYERIVRDENDDGVFIPYFVNGLGMNTMSGFGKLVEGSQVRYNAEGGGMIVRAGPKTATFEFWTMSGKLIDTFTVTKQ